MSSNFSINSDFQNNFNNSIQDYNKIFNNSLKQNSKNIENLQKTQKLQNFDEIFNSFENTQSLNQSNHQSYVSKQSPLQAGAEYFVGLDSINAQKIDSSNLSPSAKMAQDIGKGFQSGLSALNTVNKQAEDDFETFASGGDISVHEVMISSQKSSLAMQMAIQLRNQMLSAYNEFKNLQF